MDVIIVCHTEFEYVANKTVIFSIEKGVSNLIKFGSKVDWIRANIELALKRKDMGHELKEYLNTYVKYGSS